jgi:hypothetical protein
MKFQRFLILVFAAALTAGTCGATSVLFNLYVGSGGNQAVSLSIDGTTIGQWAAATTGSAVVSTTKDESDGWHTLSIDYTSSSGTPGLQLTLNYGWVPWADLQSLDATGTPVHGLQGDVFTTPAGTPLTTIYGSGEGQYLSLTAGTGPWSGLPATFQEKLTGQIYFGPNPAPPLDTVTTPPPSDPPPTDDGAAPEPAGWWLAAAALPLMLFSKLRLNRAKVRP